MIYNITPQGLKYAITKVPGSVAFCSLTILAGTRVELGKYPSGTAHFTEHTIFKGTKHKSAKVIGSYLELLGGELNAYTTKEEIVVHSVTLKEDAYKAAALLFEMVTEPIFPEDEIQKEKGVVLDEINSYKDSPANDIYDSFEEKLFAGSPLAKPILGTEESLKTITPDTLKAFVSEFFTPDRMVFTLVSPLEEAEAEKKLLAIFAKAFPDAPEATPCHPELPTANPANPIFSISENKDNNLANCVIGTYAPSLYAENRYAAALLCNILGGPASNSRLNYSLREKNGWVYGVECNYVQYRDTGIIAISIGCEEKNLKKCIKAALSEVRKLQAKPLSAKVLAAAKKQLLGQLAISGSNNEVRCLNIGKTALMFGRPSSFEHNKTQIEKVTAEDLQKAALEIFDQSRLNTLIFI